MANLKLPTNLGQELAEAKPAVTKHKAKPTDSATNTTRTQTKPKTLKKKSAAVEAAAAIAEQRYGLTRSKPKTAAERQRHLRENYVPISVMLEPEQKAKLDAIVAFSESDGLTDFLRNWIEQQPEPGE